MCALTQHIPVVGNGGLIGAKLCSGPPLGDPSAMAVPESIAGTPVILTCRGRTEPPECALCAGYVCACVVWVWV